MTDESERGGSVEWRARAADGTELLTARVSEPLAALPAVKRRVYPGIRHDLHNEPEGEAIVGDVAAWLRAHVADRTPGATP